jgi:energy-coupling factor transport system ATP-binding protein
VLADLRRTRGVTLVVISHDFVGLSEVCPRTIHLRSGVLEAVSDTASVGGRA